MQEEVKLRLSQFLDIIKGQFDDIIGYHEYNIEAEVKSIKQNRNFYYIDLVEIESGKILDSARANIFNPRVMSSFKMSAWLHDIQELVWKKILISAKPTFHKTYGFSINIQKIYAEYFLGWLEKKKKEDIEHLKDMEIFHLNTLTDIWDPTFHIAVITGEKSEGYKDFKTILDESWFKYTLTLFPSLVHGEKASQEVLQQLLKVQYQIENGVKYNAVAIMRWGGWSEGMNWTNDRALCEAVCNFPLPVISAVGHTVDQSILDMVAKYDCKTPSEAAAILIDIYDEHKQDIESEYDCIIWSIEDTLKRYTLELEQFSREIPFHITKKVEVYKKQLEWFIVDKKVKYHLKNISIYLNTLYKNIEFNNPTKILGKGYSLVLDKNGKVIDTLQAQELYTLKTAKKNYIIKVNE